MCYSALLDRIKDFVITDAKGGFGMEVKCAICESQIYDLEDGDWLECLVNKAIEHQCPPLVLLKLAKETVNAVV